jgi:creatinine amidohydrolase
MARQKFSRFLCSIAICTLLFFLGGAFSGRIALANGLPDIVFLEELTSFEVRDLIKAGKTTIIFPTGGTEQNGPHMVLGKHNFIVRHTAEQIARQLGNALVAPVLAYVPEGNVDPPTGHMLFPGTITLPPEYFMKVTEYAARSFRVHGFKNIILIGDSGPNQAGLKSVAETLNKEWAKSEVRVHYIADYYDDAPFIAWLKSQSESSDSIGTHAGISDTSQLLALRPDGIRLDKLASGGNSAVSGVNGNPSRANALYGKKGLELKVSQAVKRIRELISQGSAKR